MLLFCSLYIALGIIIVAIHEWAQEQIRDSEVTKQHLNLPMKIYIIIFWFPLIILSLIHRLNKGA